jgi:hypothetical protein
MVRGVWATMDWFREAMEGGESRGRLGLAWSERQGRPGRAAVDRHGWEGRG